MARYIDVDVLMKELGRETGMVVVPIIVPETDAQEVTRCKDCWAYKTAEYGDGYKRYCHLFKRQMQEDDFCSYGEPCDCSKKHSTAIMDGKEND